MLYFPKPDSNYERPFLVLKGKAGEKQIAYLSPFVIARQLKALIVGELDDGYKLVSTGELLIR